MNKPNKTELEYFIRYSLDSDKYKRYIELYDEIERLNKELTIRIQNSQYLVKQKDELEEEIERLKNNINKGIEAINVYQNEKTLSIGYEDLKRIRGILRGNEFDLKMFEKHLKELKGVDKK